MSLFKFKPEILTQPWLADVWPTFIRVFVGALLVGHGGQKLFNGLDGFIQGIADKGWPFPQFQGFMAVFVEFAGGVLLMVGLFTRPTALINMGLFFIITFVWSYNAPFFAGKEKSLIFLVLCTYIFCLGPGRLSVDHYLFGKGNQPNNSGQF